MRRCNAKINTKNGSQFSNFIFLLRCNWQKVHNEFSCHLDQDIEISEGHLMPPWEDVLNDFQVKLILKIRCQVLYLVSSPLNSKPWETALAAEAMTPWTEGKKWHGEGAHRKIAGETEKNKFFFLHTPSRKDKQLAVCNTMLSKN